MNVRSNIRPAMRIPDVTAQAATLTLLFALSRYRYQQVTAYRLLRSSPLLVNAKISDAMTFKPIA
jgi:hypothetical protein